MPYPWPFSSRGARMSAQANFAPLEPLDPERFDANDDVIKLWLTEKVAEAIDLISIENDNSRPDVLRSILFEHIYGSAALIQLIHWREQRDRESMTDRVLAVEVGVKYSTRRNSDYETMGKASEDIKLHLPSIMRADLEGLAQISGMTLGDYCRRVLVTHLFGMRHVTKWKSVG